MDKVTEQFRLLAIIFGVQIVNTPAHTLDDPDVLPGNLIDNSRSQNKRKDNFPNFNTRTRLSHGRLGCFELLRLKAI